MAIDHSGHDHDNSAKARLICRAELKRQAAEAAAAQASVDAHEATTVEANTEPAPTSKPEFKRWSADELADLAQICVVTATTGFHLVVSEQAKLGEDNFNEEAVKAISELGIVEARLAEVLIAASANRRKLDQDAFERAEYKRVTDEMEQDAEAWRQGLREPRG